MVLVNGDDPNAVEVAKRLPGANGRSGLFARMPPGTSATSSIGESGSAFTLLDHRFETQIARANSMCATPPWPRAPRIFTACRSRKSQRRWRHSRASSAGRKCAAPCAAFPIIDDFGHHPTAIRETLRGLRYRYPGRRLWALFEPRSNTTRRAIFQHELPKALGEADGVILSAGCAARSAQARRATRPGACR